MRWPVLLLLLPACNSLIGVHAFALDAGDDDVDAAAETDAVVPVLADARACFGAPTGLGPFCFTTIPSGNLTITMDETIATDGCPGGKLMQSAGMTMTCVISAQTIAIGGVVRAIGAYPLALVATDSITIDTGATLDVSSHRGNLGAASGTCAIAGVGGNGNTGAGGGAGGSFGGTGGGGGKGKEGAAGLPTPSVPRPTQLRAGCDGGNAGAGTKPAAIGGPGGGAVYLVAGNAIQVNGSILAGGAGGAQGLAQSGGGGGGGSGGLIGLDAPLLSLAMSGVIAANGGGGGGGTFSESSDTAGADATGTGVAAGGIGIGNNGGDGAAGVNLAGASSPQGLGEVGGGGGGGGAGYILVFSTSSMLAGTVSPPPIE